MKTKVIRISDLNKWLNLYEKWNIVDESFEEFILNSEDDLHNKIYEIEVKE
jgi:hypothetical protein